MDIIETRSGAFLFNKLGILINILPYYSMHLKEWYDLLWGIHKQTREFSQKQTNIIRNLYRSSMSNQQEVMNRMIEKYDDTERVLSRGFALYLNFYAKKKKTLDLCWVSGCLSATKMSSLYIIGIYNLNKEEFPVLDNFLRYCITKDFKVLTLGLHKVKFQKKKFPLGILSALKYVTERLNLVGMNWTPELFKLIVETTNAETIHLHGGTCKKPEAGFEIRVKKGKVPTIVCHDAEVEPKEIPKSKKDADASTEKQYEKVDIDWKKYFKEEPDQGEMETN